jgi:hypothetical protein
LDDVFLFIIPSASFDCQSNKAQRICEIVMIIVGRRGDRIHTAVIVREADDPTST